MGQGSSAISKLMDPANEVVYTDEAKRLESGESHDNFDATKFILNARESLDLQKYLYHGSTYPKTIDDARSTYREDKLVDLGYMDREHYELILRTFVNVHEHTHDFMINTLSSIQDWAGAIGLFGKTATRFFGYARKTLTELQAKMDEQSKAGHGDMPDAQIDAARKDLRNLIKELQTHTQKMLNECAALKKEILAFTNLTTTDKASMDTIVTQCMASGGTLATNLAKKQADLQFWQDQKREAEALYEKDKIIAGTTATYVMVFPPFSVIAATAVLGIYIARAVQAQENMENDDKMIRKEKADIADALQIQTRVAHFTTEWKSCRELASHAMAAVTKVELGFSDMLSNLKDLNDEDSLLDGIAHSAVDIALQELAEASQVWGHVRTVASNYKEYCIINVMGPAESQTFIQKATAGVPV